MQFLSTIVLAASALATLAAADHNLNFVNQDGTTRTIYFTSNPGFATIPELVVPGSGTATTTIPIGWQGNAYSVSEGAPNVAGALAEFAFDGFAGASYFDVSTIVDPADNDGIKIIHPVNGDASSGCQDLADKATCLTAYYNWDDVQTKSSTEPDFVILIGNLASKQKRSFAGGFAARARAIVNNL